MEPVAGASVSARPAAMAQYSSGVSNTSCRARPSSRAAAGTMAPGTWTMRARLPTALLMDVTSSTKVGRPGPTASVTLSCVSARLGQTELGQIVNVDAPDPVVT